MGRKCVKCGAELQSNVKFCPKCGTPVPMEKPDVKEPMKKSSKLKIGILVGVVAVVIAVGGFIVTRPKVIDLNDYMECNISGYDGYGTAYADLNEEKFVRDVYSIAQKKENDLSEEYLFKGVRISADATPDEKLSNGDTVKVTYKFNEDDFKKYGIKLKGKTQTVRVKDLEKIKEVDIFENLDLQFYGTAPGVSTDEYTIIESGDASFTCTVTPYTDLNVGDEITVECTSTDPVAGIKPEKMKTTVKVPDTVEHYVVDPAELTEDNKAELTDIVQKILDKKYPYDEKLDWVGFKSDAEKDASDYIYIDECDISNATILNDIQYYVRSNERWDSGCNGVIVCYELDATVVSGDEDEKGKTYHCYGFCSISTIIKGADGKLKLDDGDIYVKCGDMAVTEELREKEISSTSEDIWGESQKYIVTLDGSKDVEKVE